MPNALRVDNGPEFISHQLQEWCNGRHIALYFNRPGKPTDNATATSNGTKPAKTTAFTMGKELAAKVLGKKF